MKRSIRTIWQDRRGATLVEYGLVLVLLSLIVVAALASITAKTTDMWNFISAIISRP
jgi:pilus assembly protein Flp/PilA